MRVFLMLALASTLGACAQTPPVQTTYYAARSMVHIRVTRTLGCNTANQPIVASTVTATSSHAADLRQPRTLSLARLGGEFANSDLRMDFYADGRLKGMNVTTTGQGETILRSAIKLAELALERNEDRADIEMLCQRFKAAFGTNPLSLSFEIAEDFSGDAGLRAIPPDVQSEALYNQYRDLIGDTCLRIGEVTAPAAPVTLPRAGNYVMLRARQPALAEVGVAIGPRGSCGISTIWAAQVPVAQRGTDYDIPIPRAAMFGRQQFVAAFEESGAITQLQYARDSGAAGLVNVLQAAGEAVQTTTTEETAQLRGEADLIAAQQRLIRCRTSPANC
jgi:hypothetical protein